MSNCLYCRAINPKTGNRLRERENPRKFCGLECYWSFIRENGRPKLRKPLDRSCAICGKAFRNKPKNKQRFCSTLCRGAWQSSLPYAEWRGKLSANKANRKRGRENHKFGGSPSHPGKAVPYVMKDGTTIKLRSSWEVEVAIYLDRLGIDWLYEPRRFDLGYATYRPDFYLVEDRVYWEVKGWFHEKAKAKIAAFRDLFPEETVIVITKALYYPIANDNRRHAEMNHAA